MIHKPNLWAAGVIPLAALIWLKPPPAYECYVQSEDKPPCYEGDIGDSCNGHCPNCDMDVEGIVDDLGGQEVVEQAKTGEPGHVKYLQYGDCTYPCRFVCPRCGRENVKALPGNWKNIRPDTSSAPCVGY